MDQTEHCSNLEALPLAHFGSSMRRHHASWRLTADTPAGRLWKYRRRYDRYAVSGPRSAWIHGNTMRISDDEQKYKDLDWYCVDSEGRVRGSLRVGRFQADTTVGCGIV
jgi:hypothetical protein